MSLASMLNQSIVIKASTGAPDAFGRPGFGAGVTTNCRFEKMNKIKLLPNGNSITIDARIFVPAGASVAVDDHVEFGTDIYKVITVSVLVDGRGATRHKELELQSWVS